MLYSLVVRTPPVCIEGSVRLMVHALSCILVCENHFRHMASVNGSSVHRATPLNTATRKAAYCIRELPGSMAMPDHSAWCRRDV